MADQVTRDIIVKASVDEAYRLWSNFENFPHFMKYISSITKTGNRTSHWVMDGPLGKKLEWDVENMKCTNVPEINRYVRRSYRKGWEV